jgi:hypothetical protein
VGGEFLFGAINMDGTWCVTSRCSQFWRKLSFPTHVLCWFCTCNLNRLLWRLMNYPTNCWNRRQCAATSWYIRTLGCEWEWALWAPPPPRLISMEWTKCRSSSSCQGTICKISLAAAWHIHVSLSLFSCLVHIVFAMQQRLMFCRWTWFIASVCVMYLSNSVVRKYSTFYWIFLPIIFLSFLLFGV